LSEHENITRLLKDLRDGDRDVLDKLLPLVYDTLQNIAHKKLLKEYEGCTLDTTALVHETYLKLTNQAGVEWQDRAHFFGVAGRAMRQILVDRARQRDAVKRGGDRERTTLTSRHLPFEMELEKVLDLDHALDKLTQLNERQGQVVECRFFGGLTHEETAEVLDVSERTVRRDWTKAQMFLHRELYPEESSRGSRA
jgi:RNA polymerase sigma factor (TIGR02999 family)